MFLVLNLFLNMLFRYIQDFFMGIHIYEYKTNSLILSSETIYPSEKPLERFTFFFSQVLEKNFFGVSNKAKFCEKPQGIRMRMEVINPH